MMYKVKYANPQQEHCKLCGGFLQPLSIWKGFCFTWGKWGESTKMEGFVLSTLVADVYR